MSQETVSFTIPATYSALSRTGNMLLEMAEDAASEEQRSNGKKGMSLAEFDRRMLSQIGAHEKPDEDDDTPKDPGQEIKGDNGGHDTPEYGAAPLDHNGVPFNGEFCGSGEKPFYTSGAKTGQWKKKRGVEDADYDAWYRGQLERTDVVKTAEELNQGASNTAGHAEPPKPEVNTAAAFGGQQQQAEQPANNMPVHRNGGELMTWVSEMQAAGRLTPQVLAEAWSTTGVKIAEAVSPDPAVAEPACRKMTEFLFQRLGG